MLKICYNHVMKSYGYIASIMIGSALLPFIALAQADGSVPPDPSTTTPVSAPVPTAMATSSPAASATPRATGAMSATSTPRAVVVPASVSPTSTVAPVVAQTSASPALIATSSTDSTSDTGNSPVLWIVLAALAVLPFGYLAAKLFTGKTTQQEDKKDCKRCFDIKRLLDEKLQELTDLRGKLEGKLQGMARDQVRKAVKGTPAEGVLALAEKAETEYSRLKKLFEECMAEFEKSAFKGTIIENSLADKKILDQVEIKKTSAAGDWVIHEVLASEDTISELSKKLIDGPWYAHFWKPGKDEVTVVFKDKMFTIKFSDKSTWADAIEHGTSIGIPEDRLDFPTE